MKANVLSSTVLSILSLQCLLAPVASAGLVGDLPSEGQFNSDNLNENSDLVNRIIQKRIVGFDPKQAVETLSYLYEAGVKNFERDGSVYIEKNMIQDIMETAAIDGVEVRILGVENNLAKLKFAAHDPKKFDRTRIEQAKKLANKFQLKCDMDGKMM